MATVFDLGLLEGLTPIFVGIFVFIILYAIFQKFQIFGEKAPAGALIAAVIALLFMVTGNLRQLVTFFVPWVAVLFVLMIILLIAIMILGFTQKNITDYLTDNPGVTTAVVVIIILLFLIALNQIYPGYLSYSSDGGGVGNTLRSVVFHPKVLGVVLVLVIIAYTVRHIGFAK
ncbi:hypothetical protein HYV88_04645 [Candidatus Woesearchaeota archaeon]|nr:hypothetical protein [Candidatus Woesearchaeota archaeon]